MQARTAFRLAMLDNGFQPLLNDCKRPIEKGWPKRIVDKAEVLSWDRSALASTGLKIEWLRELVESLDGEPLLIAYEFIEDLRTIRRALGEVPALGGPTSAAAAARHIAAWNAGSLPLLAFHPAAAGHGINLQYGGARMAWLSPSWSAELTEQAIARIYRPGQTRHVTVHVCIATRTVDEMKRDRVLGKMSAQEAFRRHLEQI